MAHAKDEQHLDGPSTHPAHDGQTLDDVVHRHLPELPERRDGALAGVTREIVKGLRLGLRQPRGPELPVGHRAHRFGTRKAVRRKEVEDPAQNGGRRLAGELLIHDRPGERGEGAVRAGGPGQRERADALDVAAEHGVAAAELGAHVREVDRLDAVLGPEAGNRHGGEF
jgi:hypothetical protein